MIIEKDENELIYKYFDDLSINTHLLLTYLGKTNSCIKQANECLQDIQNTLYELKMLIYLNGEINEDETSK